MIFEILKNVKNYFLDLEILHEYIKATGSIKYLLSVSKSKPLMHKKDQIKEYLHSRLLQVWFNCQFLHLCFVSFKIILEYLKEVKLLMEKHKRELEVSTYIVIYFLIW